MMFFPYDFHRSPVTSVLLGWKLLQLPQGSPLPQEHIHRFRESPVAAPEKEAAHADVAVGPLPQATIAAANSTWKHTKNVSEFNWIDPRKKKKTNPKMCLKLFELWEDLLQGVQYQCHHHVV